MSGIGERIKQKREERGWSQSELARRMQDAGWATHYQMTISRSEDGKRSVGLDEAVSLCGILAVTLDWLACGVDDGSTQNYHNGYRDGLESARQAIEELMI